ncbi:MAG: SIR2 family protein [Gemmataceae bacterium]|nr:SIR2 family protein [Gemmataceae bacterium]
MLATRTLQHGIGRRSRKTRATAAFSSAWQGRPRYVSTSRAIAELVAGGYIRVIVTTNFDRLLEQALDAAGVAHTVLSTPDAINGAVPLAHSACTVVKLHGDYRDPRILNTLEELATYEAPVTRLLDQILDEYGLIICGWSGEWDLALRAAIERAPNRRYSVYWAYPRTLTDAAHKLIEARRAVPIAGVTADQFMRRLAEDVSALDELRGPQPLDARLAAQQVKRYLPRSEDRIRLHDLVMSEVTRVRTAAADPESYPLNGPYSGDLLFERMRRLESESASLMAMFAVAGYWVEPADARLWIQALERLENAPSPSGTYLPPYESLRRYPALLSLYAAGIAAVAAERTDTLTSLLIANTREDSGSGRRTMAFAAALSTGIILGTEQQRIPGLERHPTPLSAYLWNTSRLREALRDAIPDDRQFTAAFDRFEYLAGLVAIDRERWAPCGCFIWRDGVLGDPEYMAVCQQLNQEIERHGAGLPLLSQGAFGGSLERLREVMGIYEGYFQRYRF